MEQYSSLILWNRPLGRIGEMTHTFYITRYKNRLSISQNQFTAWLPSEITDYGYKNIFSFREEKFLGTYGLEYVYHHMYPQIVEHKALIPYTPTRTVG